MVKEAALTWVFQCGKFGKEVTTQPQDRARLKVSAGTSVVRPAPLARSLEAVLTLGPTQDSILMCTDLWVHLDSMS